jgi:hypothetical protein
MKRRIERSRARCGKSATNGKTDKAQGAGKQTGGEDVPPTLQASKA